MAKALPTGLRATVCAAALVAAAGSQAAVTLYTSEASFLDAVAGAATDTFDDLVPGQSYESALLRSAGDIGYSVASGPGSDLLYGAGSAEDAWLSTNLAGDAITFSDFGTGIGAIGADVFGSTIDGAFQRFTSIVVTVTDASGTFSTTLNRTTTGTFVGFVSDSLITSFSVAASPGLFRERWPTVDDLILANPVPEADAGMMLLAGLGVMALLVSRRRN